MDWLFNAEVNVWVQRTIGLGHAEVFRSLTLFGTSWGFVLTAGFALWLWGRSDAYALVGVVGLAAVDRIIADDALPAAAVLVGLAAWWALLAAPAVGAAARRPV